MEEELKKYVAQLEDNIWITRKCRINAAERLQANENFCRFISIYYSILTTVYTLINMLILEDRIVDVFTLIISIATTNFFLYLDTKNYKDKYLEFKENYIELDKLLDKLNEAKLNETKLENYQKIAREYNELLKRVENHKTKDYFKLIIEQNDENRRIKLKDKICYYAEEAFFILLKGTVLLLPIACGVFYLYINYV